MRSQITNMDNEQDLDQLQQALEEAIKKAEENLAGWKRTQADFENYQKRKEVESQEWINFGKQATLVKLLPVLDSFEQAVQHAPEEPDEKYKNWINGLKGIVKQIDQTLAEMGIEKIEAVGKKFDPHEHEAIREVDGEEDGIVAEQYQTGFKLGDKLIRPAQVAITKKKGN